MKIVFLVLIGAVAFAKPLSEQQLKCVQELGSYKAKSGKPQYKRKKLEQACVKNYSDKFLDCVASTERHLQTLDNAVSFCAKKPNVQKQACVQTLGVTKNHNGKPSFEGKKLASICLKNSNQKFMDCVSSTKRPFKSADTAAAFCASNPNDHQQKCVLELATYKSDKGSFLAKGKKLGDVCRKYSSTSFLDCVGKSHSISSCTKTGSSNRIPASKSK